MNTIKIDKRTQEEIDGILRVVKKSVTMKTGEKNAILNKCQKIARYSRKAMAQLSRGHYRRALYDARTQDDIAAQMRAKKAVFQAMMQGRHVDLTMAEEFQLSQMHTAIHQIRRDIEKKSLPVELCDEWVRPGEGARPYKSYWLIEKPQTPTPND